MPRTDPTAAVAYLRCSTAEQHLSPEAQRQTLEAFAAARGLRIVAWHTDAGISGAAGLEARPALQAALADLATHRAGVLLVAKRDRLARDVMVAAAVERACERLGARVLSADGVGAGDDAASAFMRSVLDAVSQFERGLIRERTRAALAVKRARGERTGECPYGHRDAGDGRLVPDAGEQAVIAKVRELRAAGLSLRAIVSELAAVGIVSRAGRPLGLTQVARLARAA